MSQYQKRKTNLDFTEARDSEWQWHQLGYKQVCTSLQTDNHASTPPLSFLQAFLPPNQQGQSTEGTKIRIMVFKMVAVRQLGFLNFKFLNSQSGEETYFASPYQILQRSVKLLCRYRDFFVIFKMAAATILNFQKVKILTFSPVSCTGPICITVPNFIKIRHTIAEIWRFNRFFSKWRPSAILDLLGVIGTTRDDHLVVSIIVQNSVEIDAVVSII